MVDLELGRAQLLRHPAILTSSLGTSAYFRSLAWRCTGSLCHELYRRPARELERLSTIRFKSRATASVRLSKSSTNRSSSTLSSAVSVPAFPFRNNVLIRRRFRGIARCLWTARLISAAVGLALGSDSWDDNSLRIKRSRWAPESRFAAVKICSTVKVMVAIVAFQWGDDRV